ncbi:MAG: replication initiator protein [Arizlama microvirus]|nr:MAG: replication initiator protein [Arizlama microvirus]
MPCYRPLLGHRAQKTSDTGKRPISFKINDAYSDLPVYIPCGKCIGCKHDKAVQWSTRCYHESKMHSHNYFVTLTYSDENLPPGGTLVKEHLQKFIKRLREKNETETIRYYAAGEYGTRLSRPHYHLLLFGHHFDDLVLYAKNRKLGQQLYTSEKLQTLWPNGFSTIGEFSQHSALYVAKYSIKKITGVEAEGHYKGKLPEFALMSRKPGIGAEWIKKFTSDCYPKDFFTINGRKFRPSRFYDNYLENERPKMLDDVKKKRINQSKANDLGGVRRYYVADVKAAQAKHFERRKFENE